MHKILLGLFLLVVFGAGGALGVEVPPGHRGLTMPCETCHTTDSWTEMKSPIDFDHRQTGFPLEDRHKNAACGTCHVKGDFVTVSSDCQTCHKDVHRAENGSDCQRCHDASGWIPTQTVDLHQMTRFPLVGVHAMVECQMCHVNQQQNEFVGLSTACYACHSTDFTNARSPNHVAAQMDINCEQCHQVSTPNWKPALFDHNQTEFALVGAHQSLDCASCHHSGVFDGTPTDCYACHKMDFEQTKEPDHVAANIETNCQVCHNEAAWEPALFDHSQTDFALTGAHRISDCASCHIGGVFTGTSTDCYACHQPDFEQAKEPDHVAANIDIQCQTCHTDVAWKPAEFDHNQTNFALTGAHTTTDCASCHVGGVFTGTPTDCYACHQPDFEQTKEPDHMAANLDTNCQTCHNDAAWTPSTFDHSQTNFALTGAHATPDCASCHVDNVFAGTSTDCYSCHKPDYEQAKDPDHMAANFDTNCQTCHTDISWEPSTFDHSETNFALTGAHTTTDCASCHIDGVFAGTPTDCYTCHKPDFEQAKDPDHVAANFDQNCLTCHTDVVWEPSTFDHSETNFALRGAHTTTDCASCHIDGVFAGTPTDCYACHKLEFEQVKDPDHVAANFDQNCLTCHTDIAWEPSTFDHSETNFALTGAHITTDCASCHIDGVFAGTPTDCYLCHKLDYEKVTVPNHVTGNFDQDCLSCHTDVAWTPSTFDHNQTGFELVGAHIATDCASCHNNGVFAGTPKDCFTCHQLDYENSKDPNHVLAQFSIQCLDCHTQSAWEPAQFDHNLTEFPLTGRHVTTDCASCHIDGVFSNTPLDCFSCHSSDFKQAKDPNHVTAGFPQDCEPCHNTNRWDPSDFNHRTYFPIYSGAHRGEWDACSDCHTQATDFKVFSCITCHEHRKSEMDDEHDDVRNYVYQSAACYDCHPNGEE